MHSSSKSDQRNTNKMQQLKLPQLSESYNLENNSAQLSSGWDNMFDLPNKKLKDGEKPRPILVSQVVF